MHLHQARASPKPPTVLHFHETLPTEGQHGAEAEALESLSKKELLSMLKFGADRIFANAEGKPPTDAELDALINRSAKVAATAGERRAIC